MSFNCRKSIQNDSDLLRAIVGCSSDAILIADDKHNILEVNQMFESLFAVEGPQLTGKKLSDYEKEWFNAGVTTSLFNKRKPNVFSFTYKNKATMAVTAIPLELEESQVKYFLLMIRENGQLYRNMKRETVNNPYLDLISQNHEMKGLIKTLEKVALFDTTILLYGESGTGKGLLARYIHQKSKRNNEPFVVINCAALPEHLLESELFGYTDGAFTGANKKGKIGLIEAANHGTLFLDEIGELPLNIQAKLLHVIQDREFTPIGETKSKKVDIRIITATNKNLKMMVKKNEFREDLYYRLNVMDVKVPPLRERKSDIVPLANYFLKKFNSKYEINRRIDQEVYRFFKEYQWPGNVRELENLIEKLVVVSDDLITIDHIPANLQQIEIIIPEDSSGISFDESLEKLERKIITETYHRYKNSRKVAECLKISQSRAARLIRKYKPLVE
ncbi:MAG TPA: PAS domain-containing protein [Bacillus bacterium]|uniref:HTH-type transcriptional regulatory protein TyrR n=1 Tax=Siminovitchia fordii TaxID=254759 RepID=A0ABQ4K982_9BACI|nr:sigma 54-interacting transcriptional regulator [Siminovitchia fordii]GIN21546.1 RNA polymerase subunit sigma-54 [Siminovitchia fordii]HBZ09834.1 PAS domain-containing protein [Bacillus sp. (in: firmicutes)]